MDDNQLVGQRQGAIKLALRALEKTRHPRTYALDEQSKIALGALMRAVLERREQQGRHPTDDPTVETEMIGVIEKLNAAGVNILQKRPSDPKPTPKPWTDPVTGEPLPNPWVTKDLGAQSILEQRDPALAAHYKAMREDAYGHIAQLQDDDAARHALASIVYDENTDKLNPFRGANQTARGDFMKRDPILARFYEAEAKRVEIPLFGKSKNMTIEARLVKDPAVGGIAIAAQQIHANWVAADKVLAQQQRAQAEAALKRLDAAG
jgi:hypothetical protein